MSTTRTKPRQLSEIQSISHSPNRNTRRRQSVKSQNTIINQKQAKLASIDIPQQKPIDIMEVPRLSIADRFMTSDYSSRSASPVPHPLAKNTTSTSPTSTIALSSSALSDAPTSGTNTNHSSQFSGSNKLASNTGQPSATEVQGLRALSIAETFMKSSSSPTTLMSRSRAASFAEELDLGVIGSKSRSVSRKPSQIHPLEKPSLFDENGTTLHNFNLDLSLSPTSSIFVNDRKTSRPWGSQDTLVHLQTSERKKSIYAQFMDQEQPTTSPILLNDYYYDSTAVVFDNITGACIKQSGDQANDYSDYEEIDTDHQDKVSIQQQQQLSDVGDYEKDDIYVDEEKGLTRMVEKEDSTPKSKLKNQQKPNMPADCEPSSGLWIACCFISCGKKLKHTTAAEYKDKNPKKKLGCGRRGWVFSIFTSLIIFVLAIYFLWPRTPLMRIEGASVTSPAKLTETKQGSLVSNVAFDSEWLVNITVDNRQNHVPTQLVRVQIIAKDALTGLIIGKGIHNEDASPESIVLASSSISTIQVPIRVNYQARDSTDTTFADLTRACSPGHPLSFSVPEGSKREVLPLHFWITLHFFGLDWLGYKPTVIATPATGGFACPLS